MTPKERVKKVLEDFDPFILKSPIMVRDYMVGAMLIALREHEAQVRREQIEKDYNLCRKVYGPVFPIEDDCINAMSAEYFLEYIRNPESHHEEYYKDIRRIFSDSKTKVKWESLKKASEDIRSQLTPTGNEDSFSKLMQSNILKISVPNEDGTTRVIVDSDPPKGKEE